MRPGISHWAGDALIGLALAAGGAVLAALAWPIPRGEVGNPGPGFLPLALAILLVALGIGCVLRAAMARESRAVTLAERKAVICIAALAGAALGFVPLGFVPTVAAFLAVLFAVLARLRWWTAAPAGCAASLALWLVFDKALGLALPMGVLPL